MTIANAVDVHGHEPAQGMLSMKRATELEDDSNRYKRARSVIEAVVQEYLCPITTELPVDPVTAEDGRVYERDAIEAHISRRGGATKSPLTNAKMGKRLYPALQIRNTIERLVESGNIDGELAKAYKQNRLVQQTKKDAERGESKAMKSLAQWHMNGENGFPEDKVQGEHWMMRAEVAEANVRAKEGDARSMHQLSKWYFCGKNTLPKCNRTGHMWLKKAADKRHPIAMADMGHRLMKGNGVAKQKSQGLVLTSAAAELGSDFACYNMGIWYLRGLNGLPKDKVQAKYFLGRAVGLGERCTACHMDEADSSLAKDALRRL